MSATDEACFAWRGTDLQLQTRVVPRSSRSRIGEVVDGRVRVHLHAPPAEGRANRELIDLIAAAFGVPRSSVTITAGLRARNKTLHIADPVRQPRDVIDECPSA